jgi:hypothetical protein
LSESCIWIYKNFIIISIIIIWNNSQTNNIHIHNNFLLNDWIIWLPGTSYFPANFSPLLHASCQGCVCMMVYFITMWNPDSRFEYK